MQDSPRIKQVGNVDRLSGIEFTATARCINTISESADDLINDLINNTNDEQTIIFKLDCLKLNVIALNNHINDEFNACVERLNIDKGYAHVAANDVASLILPLEVSINRNESEYFNVEPMLYKLNEIKTLIKAND